MLKVAVFAVVIAAASPAIAGEWKPNKANPYRGLFAPQPLMQAITPAAPKEQAKRTVVCGMTIIPADPTIDPKMRLVPKKDAGIDYKLRVIDPPICNPAR
jgi:hypothetical protein